MCSALLPTHAHPVAQDGALVVALAVGWAARRRRPEPTAVPPHSLAPAGAGPGAGQDGGQGRRADGVADAAAAGLSPPGWCLGDQAGRAADVYANANAAM